MFPRLGLRSRILVLTMPIVILVSAATAGIVYLSLGQVLEASARDIATSEAAELRIDLVAGDRQVGPLTVTLARTAHPVETWAMRIEHGGRVYPKGPIAEPHHSSDGICPRGRSDEGPSERLPDAFSEAGRSCRGD